MPTSLLFVDDQASLLEGMREFFTLRGYKVDVAGEVSLAHGVHVHRRERARAAGVVGDDARDRLAAAERTRDE